jgi:NAD(P)-dependent dehydrogenase (short-subunit alcohol dehydrogenase family)
MLARMQSVFQPNLLSGKVAFVTGGGTGIGAGIAKRLAAQGANVGLLGRRAEKLEETAQEIQKTYGRDVTCHPADVRQGDAVEAAIRACAEKLGRLDVLVCSAAGNFLAPAASLSPNGFRAVIDIDLCGTFNASRAAFAELCKTRGCIVSITATQADIPTPLQAHAGAAKAGIAKLTRDLALEWARFGVRVNAVAPGPIEDTEGMSRLAPDKAEDVLKKRVPLGRWGTISEVCEAVTFLASPAGAWVTGTTLLIDGGTSLIGPGPFLDLLLEGS